MMNFLETIENIKAILKRNQHEGTAQELLDLQLAGGTGGEVLMSVCSKLMELKKNQPDVYQLVFKEAETLIDYARSIDLYPI